MELSMELLNRAYLGNTVLEWGGAAVLAITTYVAVKIAMTLITRRLQKLADYTSTDYDDLVADLLADTKFIVIAALSLYTGAQVLNLDPDLMEVLDKVIVLALIVQGALWGNEVISFGVQRVMRERLEEDAGAATMVTGMGFVIRVVFYSLIVLVALGTLGFDITALVTGLGIGGIAVALAVQNILGDLFSSLSIVLDKPFVIGDFVVVDQVRGTVEHIGLKTTRVRSLSGEQIVVANSDLLKSRLHNFKRMTERRGQFNIGVTYDTPADQLEAIPRMIQKIIDDHEMTRFDRSHFAGFGDSALTYETVFWVLSPEYPVYMDTLQEVNLAIVRRFREEGIEFAFPTRTLHLEGADGEQRGDAGAAGPGAAAQRR